jgi:hypothetical protein
MAAPTFVQASTGTVITATSGDLTSMAGVTVGNLIVVHVLTDGTGGTQTFTDTNSSIENLAGTDNTLTQVASLAVQQVGNPNAAGNTAYLGRAIATTISATINNATGDDMYARMYEFANVSTAVGTSTTAPGVIENGTDGIGTNGFGTGTTVSDTAVTTLGVDRLALNLVAINDDLTGIAAFTGMTGGTWAMPASFESATGTDGTISLMTAAMPAAGTIDGGSDAITSDAWGVIGFALVGTTVVAPFIQLRDPWPALQSVNRSSVY